MVKERVGVRAFDAINQTFRYLLASRFGGGLPSQMHSFGKSPNVQRFQLSRVTPCWWLYWWPVGCRSIMVATSKTVYLAGGSTVLQCWPNAREQFLYAVDDMNWCLSRGRKSLALHILREVNRLPGSSSTKESGTNILQFNLIHASAASVF